jgi:hypothetical protein
MPLSTFWSPTESGGLSCKNSSPCGGGYGLYGTIDFAEVSVPNRLRMADLNSMIESLTAYLAADSTKAFMVISQLAALFKKEFGTLFGV